MRLGIRQGFHLVIALLLLVVTVTCVGGWYFVSMSQRSQQQIDLHRNLDNDLVEMLSLSSEVIYSPTPRNLRVMGQMVKQTSTTVRDAIDLNLSAEERRLILTRLESFADFNVKLKKVIAAYPVNDIRVQRAKNLIMIRNGEALGGCRGILVNKLKFLEEAHFRSYHTASVVFGGALLILTLTILALAFFTSRQILSPIRRLQQVIDAYSVGDKDLRAESFRVSELAGLAHSFNHMADRLNGNIYKLELANQELESFAYSVSHDLRGPLRAMDGFSSALEEDYAEQLDDQARSYLLRIKTASAKMGNLIEDILRLSRIGRVDLHLQRQVDLAPLCREIFAELQMEAPRQVTEITIEEPFIADCDPALMQIALKNLLGNAYKFSSKKESPKIKISARKENSATVLTVADNGDGFDLRYAEQLFLPFKRLHAADEFPGTGIGLAIVKRIADKHRGEIWAESCSGEGATFSLRLPNERRLYGR